MTVVLKMWNGVFLSNVEKAMVYTILSSYSITSSNDFHSLFSNILEYLVIWQKSTYAISSESIFISVDLQC